MVNLPLTRARCRTCADVSARFVAVIACLSWTARRAGRTLGRFVTSVVLWVETIRNCRVRRGAGRRAELMYVTTTGITLIMSMNLEIRPQQYCIICIQFQLRANK